MDSPVPALLFLYIFVILLVFFSTQCYTVIVAYITSHLEGDTMIQIDNLTFNYKKQQLFDNLNLHFAPGKIYGLLGKNGAGKTTLFKIIAGLLFPGRGSCRVFDQSPSGRHPSLLGDLFFLPETFYLPKMGMKTYVDLYAPYYPNFDRELFSRKVAEFEIDEAKELHTLSYGQKKKFLLAFAIATSVRVLLLDEPTNGVDIPSQRAIRRLIIESAHDERTIIISTHHMKELETTFDNLTIVDKGKLVLNHPVADINSAFKTTITHDISAAEDVVYSEQVAGGYSVLLKNPGEDEQHIDLDFFFSAVLKTPYEICKILGTDGLKLQNEENNNESN